MLQHQWGIPTLVNLHAAAESGSLAATRLLLKDARFHAAICTADPAQKQELLDSLVHNFAHAADEMTLAVTGNQGGRGSCQAEQGFGVDDSEFLALVDWVFGTQEPFEPKETWPVDIESSSKISSQVSPVAWSYNYEESASNMNECSRSHNVEVEAYQFFPSGDVFFESSSLTKSGCIFDDIDTHDFVKSKRIVGWGRWNIQAPGQLCITGIATEMENQQFSVLASSAFGPLPKVHRFKWSRTEFEKKFSKQCIEKEERRTMQEKKQFGKALRQLLEKANELLNAGVGEGEQ